ncbi:hypothetical protein GJAV_G00135810 [Gymnothorax javanicus]|nr:hypothetical protein GJAV_G00135810 [Gymnothorax javanicus]
MGRSRNVRKSSNRGREVGSVFSRKGRLGTPGQNSATCATTMLSRKTRKTNTAKTRKVRTPVSIPQRRGSIGLSPIHESPFKENDSLVSTEKRRDPPPPLHWKDIACSSDGSSTCRDGTSDMIMPSGVSSFLLDCMDTCSPNSPPCQAPTDTCLPSPEIFRRADDEQELEFSVDEPWEEQVQLQVKNSTLLDISQAVSIGMRPPPDLSSILEVSREREVTVLERVISPQAGVNVPRAPFKLPRKIERARPVKCRKKVTFLESEVRQDGTESDGLKVAQKEVRSCAGTEKGPGLVEISDLQLMEDERPRSATLDPEDHNDGEDSCGASAVPQPREVSPRPASKRLVPVQVESVYLKLKKGYVQSQQKKVSL